ncbi:hypothetical protein [Gemmatimonas sp.]
MPAEPVHPHGHCAAVRARRHSARPRSRATTAFRLRSCGVEHCPRRPHFDAGRFAKQFGDEGHRQGWCLYELGCKGPETHAGCSTRHFNDVIDAWPIGIGAPCVG